jgi:SAM-dependent methyltransferase
VRYEPSPPETVIRVLRALPIDYERYVFVDVGAGMGRVVLLASTFPFKAIVGVEFAPELVGIARDNIRVFPDTEVSADRVEVVCVDAVDFALPDDDLVLYLFNPFAVSVLDRFLENVTAELGDHRDVVVALLGTPEAEATIARYGFVQIAPHIHRRTGRTAAA